MSRVNVGRRVKKRRISLGLTQFQLADSVGMAQDHLSSIETGRRGNLTLDTLRRLSKGLKCSIGDLVD